MSSLLELKNLGRAYPVGEGGTLEVLRGVDLSVQPGEIIGLIGPSGSGKSSLLHAAGLLERPTSGEVLIEGRETGPLSEAQRTALRLSCIGFVYQFHHLLPEFSALDNVALPVMMTGKSRKEARGRAKELLTALGLKDRLDHQPAQLSGGEHQRVAIARALANRPRLVLADEPTGNLDPANSGAVFEALRTLAAREGVACLIATHNVDLAASLDRVFALKEGRLEAR